MRATARALVFGCSLLSACSCQETPPIGPADGSQHIETQCGNGADDDGDGATDCADSACDGESCGASAPCARHVCRLGVCTLDYREGSICRPSRDLCDVAEICPARQEQCPPDSMQAAGTVCRSATQGKDCSADAICDGVHSACPDGLKPKGTVCRESRSNCDVAEVCTGESEVCPEDVFAPMWTVCWPASGLCGVEGRCDGVSNDCPHEEVARSGTLCAPAHGSCDEPEYCDGNARACPSDVRKAAGTVCRAGSRPCEAPEVCDGESTDCPAEVTAVAPAGTICREKAGPCDVEERCDGVSVECGADQWLPLGAVCSGFATCTGGSAACPAWHQENPLPIPGEWDEVLALAPEDVWVSGERGSSHWDGKTWTQASRDDLRILWGSASDDLWALASGSLVLRWDGKAWREAYRGSWMTGIWGSGRDDVWLAGTELAHWDGKKWAHQYQYSGRPLDSIWGSGPNDVWAVGNDVLHWDGASWKVSLPCKGVWSPTKVSGSGPSDVWVGGSGGELWRYDGVSWVMVRPSGQPVLDLWTAPGADVYVVSGGLAVEQVTPTGETTTALTSQGWLKGIGGTTPDDVWAVGQGRPWHWDGTAWKDRLPGPDFDLVAVAAAPDSSAIWAAGTTSLLKGTRDGAWTETLALPSWLKSVERLKSFGANDLWVTGQTNGSGSWTSVVGHWDGTAWVETAPPGTVSAIDGDAPNDVWAVGYQGLAMRWDGTAWTTVSTGTTNDLYAVAVAGPNDVWIGTKGATLMHWDGAQWDSATYSGGGDVVAMAAGNGRVFALVRIDLTASALIAWDRTAITVLKDSAQQELRALWRRADSDVWVFGSDLQGWAQAWRYDGTWSEVDLPAFSRGELKAATGNAQGEVWAVGIDGLILHLGP